MKPYPQNYLKQLTPLYHRAMKATRSGSLFSAFPYPTKISPETIALFIAAHTIPGETVFDGFAGSGTTGLAALLCAHPPEDLRKKAEDINISFRWGSRCTFLYEISVLGSFIARVPSSPPKPEEFEEASRDFLAEIERRYAWLCRAKDNSGRSGNIRYVVWSDILQCPQCRKYASFWDTCVSRNPAKFSSIFHCPKCKNKTVIADTRHVLKRISDNFLGEQREVRLRRPAWIYGITDRSYWSRPPDDQDFALLKRIEKQSLPASVPNVEIPWGDLHRSGYHQGITHLHHFYTRRNLIAFAALWKQVDKYPKQLRDPLRFWLLSYNASHSTIMTRVVAKTAQKDLVVTGAQPGVLYVSSLPVEKNIFLGLQRKSKMIEKAFRITYGKPKIVEIRNASCLSVDLPDNSVDYVFTDPPFGGNIPYAEINFINEAWLGKLTNTSDEVIMSKHQEKGIESYKSMMTRAFKEMHRILRAKGKVTLVFHSASAQVWNALRKAISEAGFNIVRATVLEKTQGSFKQVTTSGAVRGDAVLLLAKGQRKSDKIIDDVWVVTKELLKQAVNSDDLNEMTPQRLYSRFVAYYISRYQDVPLDAAKFYKRFSERISEVEKKSTRS